MVYTLLEFQLGRVFLAKSHKGLSFAAFIKNKKQLGNILDFFNGKGIRLELDQKKFHEEAKLFSRYFQGKKESFASLDIDFISGTPFQRRVWLETRKIPHGKTASYKSIAKRLNHRGFRSVGQALARNPLVIVIPCHRVLRSDGSLGGFGGGLKLKEFLLCLEKGRARL
jgi:methylated-DNA-[protein]-cysteine S-methyltransferase